MIGQFTSGMDFEEFRSNPMAIAAVERKLQIISEAAVRLADEAEGLCPAMPWRDIWRIGNQLRHAYERIDLTTIWNTVIDDLPALKAAVRRRAEATASKCRAFVAEVADISAIRALRAQWLGIEAC
jgi:uncharacterized protein with HEPN domain